MKRLTLSLSLWFLVALSAYQTGQVLRGPKYLPSRQFVSIGALAQGPWQPHDPQHREPPEGWFCTNPGPGVPKDHECDCKHKCVKNEDYTDPETGEVTPATPGMHVEENVKCAVYCHPKRCACAVIGCQST